MERKAKGAQRRVETGKGMGSTVPGQDVLYGDGDGASAGIRVRKKI